MTAVEAQEAKLRLPKQWPISVEAYHALGEMGLIPEKTELLYGQVFYKMPKSPLHRLLIMRLQELLRAVVGMNYHVQTEQPVSLGDSEPEPDLSVIRGSINDYLEHHPQTAELVIEVCVTSHEYDRSKLRAYASASVKEVWLVLAPEHQIEVYRQPAGDHFANHSVHGPGGALTSEVLPKFVVQLQSLFPG